MIFPCRTRAQNFKNEFGFRTDNDAYLGFGQDQYYTNGLFIKFRHAVNSNRYRSEIIKKTWEVEAGQYLFNASSGDVENITEIDRPYAAYLYAGGRINWFKQKEQYFQAGLQLGAIGPDAYGRQVQETLHRLVGFYEIKGWEYQVNNETQVNSSFSYQKRLSKIDRSDLTLHVYGDLGNTFSGAGIGTLFRTGEFNKLSNSISTNSRISGSMTDSLPARESFFFVRPLLQLVVYNSTIQGPMFRKDKGPAVFRPNRLFFTSEIGYMYAKNRWSFNFSVTFQTKELKEQKDAQEYGSIALFYRFN